MPGVIDLSSVIAAMNSAASSTMSSGNAGIADVEAANRANMVKLKPEGKLKEVQQPNQGKAKWDAAQKPLSQHIMDNMAPPSIEAQDSLLSMMSSEEQKYALFTYDVVKQGSNQNG